MHDCGFVTANMEKNEQMKELISGSPNLFSEPHQSINYVESHDNHTMWDQHYFLFLQMRLTRIEKLDIV